MSGSYNVPKRKPLTFGSVFTGIGGFDKGFERAGMVCKFQIEFDKKCQSTLERHWPGVLRLGNVEEVNGSDLPRVDVLCGGFPCQDLSLAGKRKGLAGSRSRLWFEFWRLIRELAPPCVVIENVPGLLSSHGGKDLAILLGGLTGRIPGVPRDGWRNSGFVRGSPYNVAWRVLDSQYFGLAQRRQRVFIVASLGDGRCSEILFERESMCWDPPEGRGPEEGIAASLTARSGKRSRGRGQEDDFNIVPIVAGTIGGGDAGSGWRDDLDRSGAFIPIVSGPLMGSGAGGDRPAGNENEDAYLIPYQVTFCDSNGQRQDRPDGGLYVTENPDVAGTIPTSGDPGVLAVIGTVHSDAIGREGKSKTASKDAKGKVRKRDPGLGIKTEDRSPALMTGDPHAVVLQNMEWVGVRRLTPVEAARLQDFPDDFNDHLADGPRYKQFGNAVSCAVAGWIGDKIVAAYR